MIQYKITFLCSVCHNGIDRHSVWLHQFTLKYDSKCPLLACASGASDMRINLGSENLV